MAAGRRERRETGGRRRSRGRLVALLILVAGFVWWWWERRPPVPSEATTATLPAAGGESGGGVGSDLSATGEALPGPVAGEVGLGGDPGAGATPASGRDGMGPAGGRADGPAGERARGSDGSQAASDSPGGGGQPGAQAPKEGAPDGEAGVRSTEVAGGAGFATSGGSSEGGEAPVAVPGSTVVVRVHEDIEFTGGAHDWRPIYAEVSRAGAFTAGFPGVPFPRGVLVEPRDTRTPDQRERNLPRGRPRLVCTSLDWPAAEIDTLRIDAAFVADGLARVYFLRAGQTEFAADDYFELSVTGESGVNSLRFDVSAHAGWRGRISGLRLDLVDGVRPFLLERLRAIERVGKE